MTIWLAFEIVSTICGIACVYLQTKGRILAWPFGIVSVALAALIFHHHQLYSDFILHLVFFALNIYGWLQWSKIDKNSSSGKAIVTLTNPGRWIIGIGAILGTILWGYIIDRTTDADLVYVDSFTTVSSLIAQVLLARKVIENWLIWIVVDMVAVQMYLYKGLYYFAGLFLIYLILCWMGWKAWRKQYDAQALHH